MRAFVCERKSSHELCGLAASSTGQEAHPALPQWLIAQVHSVAGEMDTGTHPCHPSALAASIPGHQADGAGAALSWEDTLGVVVMDGSSAFPGQLCSKGKGCLLVLDPWPLAVVKAERDKSLF